VVDELWRSLITFEKDGKNDLIKGESGIIMHLYINFKKQVATG
jgi:hypothetical protein